jgi:light-regulated signal transduction histidine kinase (bacteriophytochrome)
MEHLPAAIEDNRSMRSLRRREVEWGAGLSICKAINEAAGGTIGFRPNVPQARPFCFTLAIAEPLADLQGMTDA